MSAQAFADRLHRRADALRDTARLLRESGEDLVDEVKYNMNHGVNAGQYRVPDLGTTPGSGMTPLAAYTLAKRESRGNMDDTPLMDTEATYRSIGIRSLSDTKVVVGPRTRTGRQRLRKQLGKGVSSDLNRPIPPRNPIGYGRDVWEKVAARWRTAFGTDSSTTTKIEIRV